MVLKDWLRTISDSDMVSEKTLQFMVTFLKTLRYGNFFYDTAEKRMILMVIEDGQTVLKSNRRVVKGHTVEWSY